MKTYLTLNSQNRVIQCGSTRGNPSDIEIEVPENHEVLRNPVVFVFNNGVLTKDEVYRQQLINQPKPLSAIEQIQKQQTDLVFELMVKGVL